MKRFLALFLFVLILPCIAFASPSQTLSLPEINAEIMLNTNWLPITSDMESVDISKSVFNVEGAQALFDSILASLKKPENEDVQAVIYSTDAFFGFVYENQIRSQKNSESLSIWDIDLHKEEFEKLVENDIIIEQYTSKNGDLYFAISEERDEGLALIYTTVNNGKFHYVSSMSDEATLDYLKIQSHTLLDSIRFTVKASKPSADDNTEGHESKSTSFVGALFDRFMNYFIYNLSWSAVSLAIGAIVMLGTGLFYLIKAILKKMRDRKSRSQLAKERIDSLISEKDYKMKWHKFLIYFSLWIGALNSIISGCAIFTGSHYGTSVEDVYLNFRNLQKIDASFGLAYIAFGVFMLITRFKLARYRKNAANYLTWCYVFQPLITISYNISVYLSTGIIPETIATDLLSSLVTSLIMIIPTRIYYKKRSDLFTE